MTSRVVAHGIGNGLRADSAVENLSTCAEELRFSRQIAMI